jgi:hypothetical protein
VRAAQVCVAAVHIAVQTAILGERAQQFAFRKHFYLSPMNGFLKKNWQRKMLLQSKLKNQLSVIRMYRNEGKMNGGGGGQGRFYLCKARHNVPAERDRRRAQINGLTGSEDKVAQLLAQPTMTIIG